MSFAFKKFTFFQQQEVAQHSFPSNATCHCVAGSVLAVGCDNGSIVGLDDSFQPAFSFAAHGHKVLHLVWLQLQHLLVTLGVEEPGISSSTLKLWDLSKLLQPAATAAATTSTALQPLKSLKVFNSKHPESTVTALAATAAAAGAAGLSQQLTIAVGLASGSVYIVHGDTGPKGKLQHASKLNARCDHGDSWSVNGLVFAAPGGSGGGLATATSATATTASTPYPTPPPTPGPSTTAATASTYPSQTSLFVVTDTQTLSYELGGGTQTILDQQGGRPGNCSGGPDRGVLVVARDDALYEYTVDTRAGCTVFEGHKQQLDVLRRYLVVVTNDTSDSGVSSSTVSVADSRNKLIAGSFAFEQLQRAVCAFGVLLVQHGVNRLTRLSEVELTSQLELLYKRGLHRLALDMATAQSADESLLASIHQRWGDHLYSKGEYDAAMAQYQHTLSRLEPSYVIRRFLDAQRIHNLTSYLELLHERGLASADHTTLLLNCYTKLKDVDKLDAFIHKDADGTVPSFDMETAYKVLRSAGYHMHALWVAERAAQPDWSLEVLLEEMGSYDEAIAFLDTLLRRDMAAAMRKYGKALISARPEDTTRLLMDLCVPGDDMDGSSYTASAADFAHLYAEKPTALMLLCEYVLNTQAAPPGEQQLYHTLLELYLTERLADEEGHRSSGGGSSGGAAGGGNGGALGGEDTQDRRRKALELLHKGWEPYMDTPKYDAEQALVLCRVHAFGPGLVFLYDKLRLVREVLSVYMADADYAGLIDALLQYGDGGAGGDPQLWAEVLEYLATQPGDCTQQISELMEHIEAGSILPPLVVLQTLAKKKDLTVSVVKGYISRQLQQDNAEVAGGREAVERMAAETAGMKAEVQKLRGQARVFQNSRCAASGQPLDLPVVHFLCGHSFNLRSLGENDKECPICAPDQRRVLEIRRSMRAGAMQQDRFFTELRETADGFGVVAEHFGRGLMNMTAQSTQQAL